MHMHANLYHSIIIICTVYRFRMKEKVSSQDLEEDMHSILYLLVCFLS